MKYKNTIKIFLVFCLFSVLGFNYQKINQSSPEEIKQELDLIPCNNKERLDAVMKLFEKLGASKKDLLVEKHNGVENLLIVKKGQSEEKIVIGAHYDKVSNGCGAIDNWSGIIALAHLYKTLKEYPTNKTLIFVAFGKEEEGLVGSKVMVNKFEKEQIKQYCAMINIDSLGMGVPQIAANLSNPKFMDFAIKRAGELKITTGTANVNGDADSSSFNNKHIPAITIHGLTNSYEKVLHSSEDKLINVKPYSIYLGYVFALDIIVKMDKESCNLFK